MASSLDAVAAARRQLQTNQKHTGDLADKLRQTQTTTPKLRTKLRTTALNAINQGHTPTQVAQAAGVSRYTIYQWIKAAGTP